MVLLGAILVHIVLIWGFAAGLGHELVKFVAPPLDTSIIEEAKVDDKPPQPPHHTTTRMACWPYGRVE